MLRYYGVECFSRVWWKRNEMVFQALTSKWSRTLCDLLSCVFCSMVKLLWSSSQALPCLRQVGTLRPHRFCFPRSYLLALLMSNLAWIFLTSRTIFSFLLHCLFHSQSTILFIVRMFMYGFIPNMLNQRGPKAAAYRMFCSWNDISQPLQNVLLGQAALRKEMVWKTI